METQKKVKVFSTPTCPWCALAKKYLNENRVDYEDIDVSTNPIMANEMINKSGQMGVPQIWIDNEYIVGFDKPKIDNLLNL